MPPPKKQPPPPTSKQSGGPGCGKCGCCRRWLQEIPTPSKRSAVATLEDVFCGKRSKTANKVSAGVISITDDGRRGSFVAPSTQEDPASNKPQKDYLAQVVARAEAAPASTNMCPTAAAAAAAAAAALIAVESFQETLPSIPVMVPSTTSSIRTSAQTSLADLLATASASASSATSVISAAAAASSAAPEASASTTPALEASKQQSFRPRHMHRIEIRGPKPAPAKAPEEDSDVQIASVVFNSPQAQVLPHKQQQQQQQLQQAIPRGLGAPPPPSKPQLLRISAGRAAAAAGIHPMADIGELFVELLYQDNAEMLLQDAFLAGVQVVEPIVHRELLLEKSGSKSIIEATLQESQSAQDVATARTAQEVVRSLVKAALDAGKLSLDESEELRSTLELEINLQFGARHEDAALAAYSDRVGRKVYGDQRRISIPLPKEGPVQALGTVFPAPLASCLSQIDAEAERIGKEAGIEPSSMKRIGNNYYEVDEPFFRLTGFVDGLVDLPRKTAKHAKGDELGDETVVLEVKHRMGKVKEPPEIYDIVQLSSYCRALGCTRGELVQCLRVGASATSVGTLHITPVDFREGSHDRTGWDRHVLPGLYCMAAAVYEARENPGLRVQLLAEQDPKMRIELVRQVCEHLR
mmetsp:Transcript_66978/g.139844  ORF Transcript_66978/g.139844 Transcript_66978/m.139844 type:complete len:639 (+) Transcript_66978:109-2025(+)